MTVLFSTVPQHSSEQTLTKYLLSQRLDQRCPRTRQHVHLQVLFTLALYFAPISRPPTKYVPPLTSLRSLRENSPFRSNQIT